MMKHKRLYISSDIEGVAGVVSKEQCGPAGFEYSQARIWMTDEVNAACEAAFDCGVEEIVISDSHGNAQNLLPDRLPKGVQLVRGWPRPLGMMEGVDQGAYDGALLLGYHTGVYDRAGVLAHTLSGKAFRGVRLNGKDASETVISAGVAAAYGVPVIMVSGDDAYGAHAEEVFGDIETAVVKWSHSTTSARSLLPQDACDLIREKTKAALGRLEDFKPAAIATPIEIEVDFMSRKAAELIAYLPVFERTSVTALRFTVQNMDEAVRSLKFLTNAGTLA